MLESQLVEVWSAVIPDRPGGLLEKLEGLAKAGADLQIMGAYRSTEKGGQGVVLLAPLTSELQIAAAKKLGFERNKFVNLRVSCADEPGKGYLIAHAIAAQGINLAALAAAALGRELVMYLSFDTAADAHKAQQALAHVP